MRYGRAVAVLASMVVVSLVAGGVAYGGGRAGMVRHAGDMGGSHGNIDIVVRQVTVTPIRAYVGDTVRVDVVIENKGDGSETIPLEVSVNKKVVARKLFTFGMSPADMIYHETLMWNTRGDSPGEYRIRAEAFVWRDSSPFDNSLEVKQVLLLAAPGTPFPDGKTAGGSATETDPRFKSRTRDKDKTTGEGDAVGGY